MQDLLQGYKETRRMLKRLYKECQGDHSASDRELISSMIGEVEWIVEWLETGKRPGNRRGIERRAAYQREKLVDPIRMQAYVSQSTAGSPANITEWQRQQIEDALSELSERERECYLLAHGECFSHVDIANMLNISVSSVETYIKRANTKVSERVQTSLFLAV
ncbi:sigma factor-like helix-turn-helix DNA-binding protein [Brevibacillus borstelensis]|uniref:sigma factor-like helix-turn-helix DNA-binding protein n=1 Tax=Brevibacillus borstelensis TaxID=45462 RepID=UPI002E22A541|nr:sigma factor-like helix-turn-helix DNA-binding protein [Brevibacillus borstelensis]MED2006717.1 sigma factor-like helix-turn-helix DNA-binding protein [Brevibacillus borstelensis]